MVEVFGIVGIIVIFYFFVDIYFGVFQLDIVMVCIIVGFEGWKGLDGVDDFFEDFQGGIFNVKFFNNNYDMIGLSGGGDVEFGEFLDIKVS